MTIAKRLLVALGIAMFGGLWIGACAEQRVDDATLTADVQSRLARTPELMGTEISVTSDGAVVVLQGDVLTEDQRGKAEDVAEAVPGVRDVENHLTVAANAPPTAPPVAAPPPAERPGETLD